MPALKSFVCIGRGKRFQSHFNLAKCSENRITPDNIAASTQI